MDHLAITLNLIPCTPPSKEISEQKLQHKNNYRMEKHYTKFSQKKKRKNKKWIQNSIYSVIFLPSWFAWGSIMMRQHCLPSIYLSEKEKGGMKYDENIMKTYFIFKLNIAFFHIFIIFSYSNSRNSTPTTIIEYPWG